MKYLVKIWPARINTLNMTKPPLIIIAGPTAVGKTSLSIKLAKMLGGEIVSADSMQVYRGLDIGSAKVTRTEMDGVRHHLIDCLEPTEDFNVFRFKEMAKDAVDGIISAGKLPIMVGGTGFYIQAVLYDIDFSEEDGGGVRKELEKRAETEGAEALYKELIEIDSEYTKDLHPNNVKRVIRALEFYRLTGQKLSEHNEEQRRNESPYNFAYFVITDERAALYDRINRRVDKMMDEGLLDEVRRLYDAGLRPGMTAAEGIGYKQIIAHFDGEMSLDEAVEKIKLDSRHYAKRQLTWFRREKETIFIDRQGMTDDEIIDVMSEILMQKNIAIFNGLP